MRLARTCAHCKSEINQHRSVRALYCSSECKERAAAKKMAVQKVERRKQSYEQRVG